MENKDYKLLVVDDGEENLDMLSRRLKRRGFQVLTAEGGERALEIARSEPLDLVLLDIMMPGVDGLQVLRELRRTWNQNELPVIMQTAKAESENVVEALDLGANDYVTKPIDFPVVLARVQSQLRGKVQATAPPAAAEPSTAELGPGAVIDGKYRLGDKIGQGTFGTVYHGQHIELEVDVAVKVLQKSVTATEESLRRFRQEGVAAYRVRHPHAVAVNDFGVTASGVAYLVMELLKGHSLAHELERSGVLTPQRTLEIVLPICDVLAAAHAMGIVHRDVKPENVFLHQTPLGEVVKVLDFGISKLVGENIARDQLTAEGFVLGTPAYMAPERLVDEPYDGRSDVYSLGIMLFYMLTGKLPFVAQSGDPMSILMMHLNETVPLLSHVNPDLPKALGKVVARATDKTPHRRPDAVTLARELAAAVDGGAARPATRSAGAAPPPAEVDASAPTIVSPTPASGRRSVRVPAEEPGLLGRLFQRIRGD